ncbi:ATPase alpha subunit [Perkinsela sp. CCAP 1560/4]|nr:ATPase alpha subunit [Perkinsela sp. CCAP 1560/4]|eukprot:KNH08421.1 ATPase alpha subunit [Perkinsela sp. CCAP 1560/4]
MTRECFRRYEGPFVRSDLGFLDQSRPQEEHMPVVTSRILDNHKTIFRVVVRNFSHSQGTSVSNLLTYLTHLHECFETKTVSSPNRTLPDECQTAIQKCFGLSESALSNSSNTSDRGLAFDVHDAFGTDILQSIQEGLDEYNMVKWDESLYPKVTKKIISVQRHSSQAILNNISLLFLFRACWHLDAFRKLHNWVILREWPLQLADRLLAQHVNLEKWRIIHRHWVVDALVEQRGNDSPLVMYQSQDCHSNR